LVANCPRWFSALFLLWVGLWPAVSGAASARIEVVGQLQVGQSTELRLVVVDGVTDGVPAVPATSHLNLTYRGQSQSFMSRNLSTERSLTHLFSVLATKAGAATVGPVTLQIDGQAVVATAVQVAVAEREVSLDAVGNQLSAYIDGSADAVLWEGEAFLYDLRFRHTEQVSEVNWTPPDFSGFFEDAVVEPVQKDYTVAEDGKSVGIVELSVPLVASSVGLREIPPAVFSVKHPAGRSARGGWPSIFGNAGVRYRTESVPSNPVTVNVRALPKRDRPATFSGAVGRFEVDASLSSSRLSLGETTTLTVVITGNGPLQGIQLPGFPDALSARAYDDAPHVTASIRNGAYRSRAVFKRAIVPSEEGLLQLPAVSFSWFAPASERYVEREVQLPEVVVDPGEASELEVQSFRGGDGSQGPSEIETLGEDILPLHAEVGLGDQSLRAADPLPWLMAGIPGLSFLALLGLGIGRRPPNPRAERILALRESMRGAGPLTDGTALEPLFREAVALQGRALPAAVDPAFIEGHFEGDTARDGVEWYRVLEQARFGGGRMSETQCASVLAWIDQVARGLEA